MTTNPIAIDPITKNGIAIMNKVLILNPFPRVESIAAAHPGQAWLRAGRNIVLKIINEVIKSILITIEST